MAATNLAESLDGTASEIRRALEILVEAGDVLELRAFKDHTTVSGYFDNFEELAQDPAKLEGLDRFLEGLAQGKTDAGL